MYAMNSKDKLLLELYKAIGTPEEIIKRLDSPYPAADGGYAPAPWAENFEGDGRPDSGLLTDDGEDPNYKIHDGLEWTR